MAKLNRDSDDPMERIEWQLNEMRHSLDVLAWGLLLSWIVAIVILVGVFVATR